MVQSGAIRSRLETLKHKSEQGTPCSSVGINEKTLYAWIARGENAKSGLFCEFCKAIQSVTYSYLRRHPLLGPCQFLSRNDRHSAMLTNALRSREQACFVQPFFGHAGSITKLNC